MTQHDFIRATALFANSKITAFLQGGLTVTGSWAWLNPWTHPDHHSTSIVVIDGNNVRSVIPLETITSLREVPTWTKRNPGELLATAHKKETIG